jgi:acyl-coenzyme A thioesterase PaaI-like protein
MAEINTHKKIDQHLCGRPLEVGPGRSRVLLQTIDSMAADSKGLVHGGFIFGIADYAAMLAVNDPNVVLGRADVKFLKPIQVGQPVIAEASVTEQKGNKNKVTVSVKREADQIFYGEFICFVLAKHVLS